MLPGLVEDELFSGMWGCPCRVPGWEDCIDLSALQGVGRLPTPSHSSPSVLPRRVLCWVRTPPWRQFAIPNEGLVTGFINV